MLRPKAAARRVEFRFIFPFFPTSSNPAIAAGAGGGPRAPALPRLPPPRTALPRSTPSLPVVTSRESQSTRSFCSPSQMPCVTFQFPRSEFRRSVMLSALSVSRATVLHAANLTLGFGSPSMRRTTAPASHLAIK